MCPQSILIVQMKDLHGGRTIRLSLLYFVRHRIVRDNRISRLPNCSTQCPTLWWSGLNQVFTSVRICCCCCCCAVIRILCERLSFRMTNDIIYVQWFMYQAIPGWLSLFRIIIITPQWCDGTNLGRIRSRCPQQQDDYCTHGDQPVLEGVVVVYAHFTGYNRGSNNMITTTTIQPCSTTKSYHFFDLLWDRPPYRLYYRK